MRLTIIVLTLLFLGASCGKKVPEGVVPQKQMTALLLDMHLADGEMASMMVDSARIYRNAYYQAIFDRYGIDSTAFERSIEFYSTRPALMNKLYIAIEKKLNAMNLAEQKAIEEGYAAKRRADSVVNAKRTDSLRSVARDSLDFKRKRYLIYLNAPDSVYGKPLPVTYTILQERMLEALYINNVPAVSVAPPTPKEVPLPDEPVPETEDRPKPALPPLTRSGNHDLSG